MFLGNLNNPFEYNTTYPIYNDRRFTHTYIIGKTGVGKSTLLENLAIQDVLNREGVAFFDPHGDSIDKIMEHIPPEKVILFDPTDEEYVIGFNPLCNPENIPFTVSALADTFSSVWDIDMSVTSNIYLYLLYGLTALAYAPEGTLFGFKYFINSKKYREYVLSHVTDNYIKDWWSVDFDKRIPDREQRTTTLSTLSRFASMFIDPKMRCIFGQPKNSLRLDKVMEKGKCLLVKLPQGKLGIKKSAVIGALIMAQLHSTALGRKSRKPFHIYADEAHHFGTNTLEEMLSGVRKFGVSMVIANQYLGQLSGSLRSAILGTVGTIVAFPVGTEDAETLAKEMGLSSNQLIEQEPFNAWVKTDRSYNAKMFEIYHPVFEDSLALITQCTRNQYAKRRLPVEWKLNKFMKNIKNMEDIENKKKKGGN